METPCLLLQAISGLTAMKKKTAFLIAQAVLENKHQLQKRLC